jgi:hypothetical protein
MRPIGGRVPKMPKMPKKFGDTLAAMILIG